MVVCHSPSIVGDIIEQLPHGVLSVLVVELASLRVEGVLWEHKRWLIINGIGQHAMRHHQSDL